MHGDLTGEEQQRLSEIAREAISHRDDYENKCIRQSIEIRRLRAELEATRDQLAEAQERIGYYEEKLESLTL